MKSNRFKKIVHRFPEPGHSFLPCDRCFGVLEKAFRKAEKVYVPQEYVQIINKTSRLFNVIRIEQNQIKNFVELAQPYFKRITINKYKERFCISQYRVFLYDSEYADIQCSKSVSVPTFVSFPICKSGVLPEISAAVPAYGASLPLKKIKYDQVMSLANRYVPQNDMWYYHRLNNSDRKSGDDTEVSNDDANE